jgi:Domain of unknown function (DUF5122) beta-propeller
MKPWGRVVVAAALATPLVWTSTVAADGEPEPGFGVNGVVIDPIPAAGQDVTIRDVVEIPGGGGLFVAGDRFLATEDASAAFLVKYLPSGSRDPSFGTDGIIRGHNIISMAAFPDGRLLVYTNLAPNANQSFGLAIVSQDGQLVPGPVIPGFLTKLIPRPDGSIIALGDFLPVPGSQQRIVARVITPAGTVDSTFAADVSPVLPRSTFPNGLGVGATLASDGRLVEVISSSGTCILVAFTPGGDLDTSFGTGGAVDTGLAPICQVDRFLDDDSIRVFSNDDAVPANQYSPDGAFLQTLAFPFDDPKLAMEGTGYSYRPQAPSFVVAYDPLGNVDTTFGVNGAAELPAMRVLSVKVLASGDVVAIGEDINQIHTLAIGLISASFGTARQPPAVDTNRFVPVTPTRILDTREGIGAPQGKLPPGGQVELQIAGVAGVPDTDISAVVLNVTATEATQAGFVSAYPSGTRLPLVSNVNLESIGQTAANLVTVKVGANGKVTLFTSGGSQLVADVAGYYTPALSSTDGRLQTAAPERILDTRAGLGAPLAKLPAGGQIDVQITGRGPVPAVGVSAVVLNITGDQATADGFVTAWPTGSAQPVVSNLNLVAGETRPNLAIVPLGAGGKVSLFSSGGANLIADVAGWFTDSTAGDDGIGLFVPITPTRVLDTRHEATAPTTPGSTLDRLIGSTTVVPPHSTVAVAANITMTQSGGPGFVTVWPAGIALPGVSNLNSTHAGQTIPNATIVPLNLDKLALYTQSGAQLIVDINGWYTNF